MPYDLLIKNACIIDGSGKRAYHGSVAINNGMIAGLGAVAGLAKRVIDADGLIVTPGFIDIHTHYDAQVTWDPLCTPSCFHGTTTVIMGNCGYAMAPVRTQDRDYVMGTFSRVEGVSKDTLVHGIPWEWETLSEYRTYLSKVGLGINIATQVGHSAIRRFVIGQEAHERAAKDEEIENMAQLVRSGIQQGSVGFTTSRVPHQKGELGEPIPSFVATEAELFRLADVLKELDKGMIGINPKTKATDFVQSDKDQLFKLASATGRAVNWNEFNHRWHYPNQWRELLDYMENAHRYGALVYAVMRCQKMDLHFNLREGNRFASLPTWNNLMGHSLESKLRLLNDKGIRSKLADELRPSMSKSSVSNPHEAMFSPRFDRIGVTIASSNEYRSLEGRILTEVANDRKLDAASLFLDIAREECLQTEFAFMGVTNNNDDAVEAMLKSHSTIIGISDAGAHLHTMSGVDYPTYFLSKWVREKMVFTIEEGIRNLTSIPARIAGLNTRGLLQPGYSADLCILNFGKLSPGTLEVWNDLPGGESRHVKRAHGIEWVIVNGQPILHKGEQTGARPGLVLQG